MLLRIEAEAGDVVLRILRTYGLHHPHGDQVLRSGKRRADTQRAIELAVVVLGFPCIAARLFRRYEEGRIIDDRRRGETLFKRRRIDERLEARARLALRLRDV